MKTEKGKKKKNTTQHNTTQHARNRLTNSNNINKRDGEFSITWCLNLVNYITENIKHIYIYIYIKLYKPH